MVLTSVFEADDLIPESGESLRVSFVPGLFQSMLVSGQDLWPGFIVLVNTKSLPGLYSRATYGGWLIYVSFYLVCIFLFHRYFFFEFLFSSSF